MIKTFSLHFLALFILFSSFQVTAIESDTTSERPTSTTAFYSYQSDLSNPKLLEGATLKPRQTYFFITDNGQYKKVTFYCCKGLNGDAAGEPHAPAITNLTAPYRFSRNTADMASGTRELYFDSFPTAGGVENYAVNFTLNRKNTSPVISGSPANRVDENSHYNFQPSASDVDDDDALTFSISGQPVWAFFDTNTGRLSGIPKKNNTGKYSNIIISVSDGTDTTRLPAFNIQVVALPITELPISTTAFYSYQSDLSNPKLLEGATLEPRQTYFFVTDNGQYKKVTFYCCRGFNGDAAGEPHAPAITDSTAPYRFSRSTADMASGTRELYFDTFPTAGGVENYAVNFNLAASSINRKNTPPVISGSPANRVDENSHYNFQPSASDADSDTLTFSISGKPHWAVFDSNKGRLSGTPAKGETGSYNNIIISVTDGIDTARLSAFNIQVEPVKSNKSNEKPTTTAFYSYQSDLSNPQPLKGAILEPRQTYFFISDNGQYKAVTFYCCKGLSGDATGEPHEPAIVDKTSPYRFSHDTTSLTSGTRELYFDAFPSAGNIESHVVNFSVASGSPTQTGSFTVSWTAPDARTDGSALGLSEIAGYTVHYGPTQENYSSNIKVNDHSAVSTVIKNIPAGTYHVAVSTRDTDGRESAYSNAIVVTVK